ncbi:hypothetical protein ACLG6S_11125 [Thermodesulfobacteriota bacterium B35]
MSDLGHAVRIDLPDHLWQEIIGHCRRKLAGDFLPGETPVRRAYGILAGDLEGEVMTVRLVLPVKKNARGVEPFKTYMDTVMAEHAVQSTTPMDRRGWITDPEELMACFRRIDEQGFTAFGTYHMHIVAWAGDPTRDTPTRLDTVLARNSNLVSFIISMVDREHPTMRAFYEGRPELEIPISITG